MEKLKVAFWTLGCKVNQYESNAMAQKMIEAGYEVVDSDTNIDIYIINTCTVTNISDRKSRQTIRKIKEHNPNAIIVATGCYAQVSKEVLMQMPEIDIILGNNEKKDIVKYVSEYKNRNIKEVAVTDILSYNNFSDFGTTTYTEKTRAAIKIQDGCDRYCTYCIIPYARGKVRSRKPESILKEIEEISKKGIKEVVLTGIHIASYGKDFEEDYKLINLVEDINKIKEIKRIRLGSIEPTLITDKFVLRLSKVDKICHHFHLSLQSGCDETLKRMNRQYTTEEFIKVVNRLRKTFSDAILTTDIIVGFPGETEEEFEKTYKFLKDIKFYKMHVFPYSARKGTAAAKMPNQIDGNVKEERSKRLIDLSNKNEKDYNDAYVGKSVEVLIEEKFDFQDGSKNYKGHTANYIWVKVDSKDKEIKESDIINVKIIRAEQEFLIGKII